MREIIFEFVNQYAVWGILFITIVVAFLLWRMQQQLKRLNRSLTAVTGNIQEYFNVIMEDEPVGDLQRTPTDGNWREERFLTNEEREILQARRREASPEEEEVFHTMMEEYFS